MLGIILMVLRFVFLGLFYLFLLRLTLAIYEDLKKDKAVASDNRLYISNSGVQFTASNSDGAGLVILASTDPGLTPGTKIPLGSNTLLGRASGCNILVGDSFVSSKHAVIKHRDSQYWLEDLKSLNGTYLNEIKLESPAVLADGDRVRIGGVSFEFVRWAYEVESNN